MYKICTKKISCLFFKDATTDEDITTSIFEDCLQAELVPLTFHEYRRKLIFLQKLVYSNTRHTPDIMKEGPLRYLIGMLYLNLSTMWDPVMTIITTYAVEENKKTFWNVFYEYVALDPSVLEEEKDEGLFSSLDPQLPTETLNKLYQSQLTSCIRAREDNRVDHHNFRLLLWKTMVKFPLLVEARSRQVIPLFLDFIRYGFYYFS